MENATIEFQEVQTPEAYSGPISSSYSRETPDEFTDNIERFLESLRDGTFEGDMKYNEEGIPINHVSINKTKGDPMLIVRRDDLLYLLRRKK